MFALLTAAGYPMVHSAANNVLAAAGVAVIRSRRSLQRDRHNKKLKSKVRAATRVFLIALAYSEVDGYRTPRPGSYLRIDHPLGLPDPSGVKSDDRNVMARI